MRIIRSVLSTLLAVCLGGVSGPPALAVELGPLTISGFAKVEFSRASNQCGNCQTFPNEDRQKPWADAITSGVSYGNKDSSLTLFQPYLGTREFDLGQGFKLKGLLSQRWRDGRVDIPGVWYEKNATLSHEDYGSVQVGAFPTRSWSLADYPYGTNLGIADSWASSGAGYGLLTRAVRYSLPLLDVAGGDLQLELTHDAGDAQWNVRRPVLWEAFARYVNGAWMVDLVAQSAKNGQAMAWGHGPFTAASTVPTFNGNLPAENSQSIVMLMLRHQWDAKTDVFGGVRWNRWSGAKGVPVGQTAGGDLIWANMFNVNAGDIGRAYPATSTDLSLGAIHRFMPQWSARLGLVHLGQAQTSNPTERGQSNSMWLGTVGLGYEVKPGMSVYGYAGMVQFERKGLAPLSMPANSAFTGVDPRVASRGNWAGIGLVYVF